MAVWSDELHHGGVVRAFVKVVRAELDDLLSSEND